MNRIKKYINNFKMVNGKNAEIKLVLAVIILILSIFNGFSKVNFQWEVVLSLIIFLFSITCHEFAHGYVAYLLGDDTAKKAGRLSLNPLKHLDLEGLVLPFMLFLLNAPLLMGWAKPVPVSFWKLKGGKWGVFLTVVAGIVVNFFLALICWIILYFLGKNELFILMESHNKIIVNALINFYLINIILALFNLIPITPLDGGRIVHNFGGEKIKNFYNKMEKYGIVLVFIFVYIGVNYGVFEIVLEYFINILKIPKYWLFL